MSIDVSPYRYSKPSAVSVGFLSNVHHATRLFSFEANTQKTLAWKSLDEGLGDASAFETYTIDKLQGRCLPP